MVKGVGHLGHDEAMEAGGRELSLHGRVVKGVGHLGHDEAMEADRGTVVGWVFSPGNRYGFLIWMSFFQNYEFILNVVPVGKQ